MKRWKPALKAAGSLIAAGCLATAFGAVARPGTVNYAEGQVSLDGKAIGAKSLGSTEVAPGHVLQTANGNAEMLLTPGVYLRIGNNAAVRMVSPSLTDTRVDLLRGEANLEVDMLARENRIAVGDAGANVEIQKKGLYSLNANPAQVAVYDGEAQVQAGDRTVEVKKGRELAIAPTLAMKPQKFDRDQGDALYSWSKLRSQYESEANASAAQMVVVNNPGWWAGTGWYWDPMFDTWAFIPGVGYFANPWGFGFYSPAYIWSYGVPFGYYGYPGFYGQGRFEHGGRAFVGRGRAPATVTPPPAVAGSGLRFGGRVATPHPSFAPPAMRSMRAPAMGGSGIRFGGGRR